MPVYWCLISFKSFCPQKSQNRRQNFGAGRDFSDYIIILSSILIFVSIPSYPNILFYFVYEKCEPSVKSH